MTKLAANLSMLFGEHDFLDRFEAAAKAGFKGIEYLFPYESSIAEVCDALASDGLTQVLFNFPAGDWAAGERGLAALPERRSEFRAGIGLALEYAKATGCKRLHAMAGCVTGGPVTQDHLDTYAENVRYAADAVAGDGIEVMVEPINSRVDMPGYVLDTTAKASAVLEAVDRNNVRIQYDIYHMQIMEGDLARNIEALMPKIGHIQLADNPGRNEPGTGEIDYPWLLAHLDKIGYTGWVGCEYKPAAGTAEGLGWAADYL